MARLILVVLIEGDVQEKGRESTGENSTQTLEAKDWLTGRDPAFVASDSRSFSA